MYTVRVLFRDTAMFILFETHVGLGLGLGFGGQGRPNRFRASLVGARRGVRRNTQETVYAVCTVRHDQTVRVGGSQTPECSARWRRDECEGRATSKDETRLGREQRESRGHRASTVLGLLCSRSYCARARPVLVLCSRPYRPRIRGVRQIVSSRRHIPFSMSNRRPLQLHV